VNVILRKSLVAIRKSPPHSLGVLAKEIEEDPFDVRPVVDKALREGLIKQFNGCFRITPSGSEALEDSGKYTMIDQIQTVPKGFWDIISLLNWREKPDVESVRQILQTDSIKLAMESNEIGVEELKMHIDYLRPIINSETKRRVESETPVFSDNISYGADDCHFMDMPAHLIALGEKDVLNYLNGGVIEFEPVECFLYAFQ